VLNIAIKPGIIHTTNYFAEHYFHFHFGEVHAETLVAPDTERTDIPRQILVVASMKIK